MKTLSFWKKSFYSALVFFGTLIILSIGYAALSGGLSTTDLVGSGSGLTATSWNRLINGVLELDTRTAPISALGGNIWVGITPTNGIGSLQIKDGIAFPGTQIPVINPNTLDDYEEGTWTPVLGGYATQGSFVPGANTSGSYIKIGRQVTVWFYVHGTVSGASADYLTVNGLPFINSNDIGRSESWGSISWISGLDMGVDGRGWFMYPARNTTKALIGAFTQNGTKIVNPNVTMALYGTIVYYTAN